jgi:threonine dehydratase
MDLPDIRDVLDARRLIAPYITRTPLRRYPDLCELTGADLWVKHENHQILGSFKVRGGLNLIGRTSPHERSRGFVTASTGNHGHSIAFAAATFGAKATVVVPVGANPVKVRAMESLGGTIIHNGDMFERAREHAETLAAETGARYVHPANEPTLIAGVGTYSLEVAEDLADIDFMIVPMGAGSGASGACIVMDAVSPSTKVIAAQSAEAPAGYLSWKSGELMTAPMRTFAEGVATAQGYDLPQRILREKLEDFVLVRDARIREAMYAYLAGARTLVEGAGAVALGAAMDLRDRLRGKRVVVVASGGNVTPQQLLEVVTAGVKAEGASDRTR